MPTTPDAVRSRKATSNRLLTVLKAALNHAFAEGKVASDHAWRQVKPHREVDAPVVRYLTPAECVRLVNASDGAFRTLVPRRARDRCSLRRVRPVRGPRLRHRLGRRHGEAREGR